MKGRGGEGCKGEGRRRGEGGGGREGKERRGGGGGGKHYSPKHLLPSGAKK